MIFFIILALSMVYYRDHENLLKKQRILENEIEMLKTRFQSLEEKIRYPSEEVIRKSSYDNLI